MEYSGYCNYLISAIRVGTLKKVKKLINNYTFPEVEQHSCFCLAVFVDRTDIVKLFLEHDFVFLDKTTNTCPAIQIATHNNNVEIIEELLERGVEIDLCLEPCVLYLASCRGNEKVLKLLLSKDVNILMEVRGPLSCIHVAVEKGHLNIIEFLLMNGADVNTRYPVKDEVSAGSTILHRAVEIGSTATVELLVKYGSDVNAERGNGVTALHIAVERGFSQICKLLIQNGASVNSMTVPNVDRDYYRESFYENQIREYFLGFESADAVNTSGYEGAFTPLHVAVKHNQEKLVKLLLEHGSNVDTQDSHGNTILLLAVQSGCPAVVEHVLSHHPNTKNKSNQSALSFAAKFSSKKYKRIIESLLSCGFSCGSRHPINYDLLFNAVRNNHVQIVQKILDAGANVNELNVARDDRFQASFAETLLYTAVRNGDKKLVELLIQHGADVNLKCESGRCPISCAVENLNLEVTKLLLAKGAQIQNDPEFLLIAVQEGHLELVKVLLSHGADVSKVVMPKYISVKPSQYVPVTGNEEYRFSLFGGGVTAVFIAAQEGFVDILQILFEYGANKNFRAMNEMTPLLISAAGGHFKVVELLLKSGANIHSVDSDARTALHLAAESGYEDVMKLLLKHGTRVDSKSKIGMTPLLSAAAGGHIEAVTILFKFGASLDSRSIIHIAAKFGHHDLLKHLLKYLLENNADFDCRNNEGRTPLFVSAAAGHLKTAQVLLGNGANVNSVDLDNEAVLHAVACEGHHDVLKLLLKYGAKVDFRNGKNKTALFIAAEKGHYKIVETLIECGASIDFLDQIGRSSLTVATKLGHDEIVRLLLAEGANYDFEEEDLLPLLVFAKKGHLKIIEILIESGAGIDSVDCNGRTALYLASEYNHVSVVQSLLKHGAKISIADRNGKTPLLISAERGHRKTIGALLKHGANIESQDHSGRTALYFSAEYNRIDVVKYLLKCGANVDTKAVNYKSPLIISAERGNFDIVEVLFKAGAKCNSKDSDGFTALHFATEYNYIDTMKLLLEHGAEVDSKTKNGKTPLFISAERGRSKAAEFLLKSGACADATDKNGLTALHFATEYGHDKVVMSLMKFGAKIDCKTTGDIPLVLIAAERGHLQTVLILLKWGAKIDLVNNPHLVTYLVATIHSWKSQVFQAFIEYGSADLKVLNESNIRPFFDILNRCTRDRLHRSGIPQILVYHTIKMQVAGIYVGGENLMATAFSDETVIEDFRAKCVAEIEMMKSEIIENSFLSFHDIIMKDLNRLATIVKHPCVNEIFKSDDYKFKFPIYASFLSGQLLKGRTRRELLRYGVKLFSLFFCDLPSLPYDLVEKIVSYLNDQELRRLLWSVIRSEVQEQSTKY